MATVKQYVTQLRTAQRQIANKLGVDVTQTDRQTRVIIRTILALLAVVIKVLVDQGVITDGQLQTAYQQAMDDTWPAEPEQPPEGDA